MDQHWIASLAILERRGPLRHTTGVAYNIFVDLRYHWVNNHFPQELGLVFTKFLTHSGYPFSEVASIELPWSRRMENHPLAG
jgi:hypothetical protein